MNEQAIHDADELLDQALEEEAKKSKHYGVREAVRAVWRHVASLKRELMVMTALGIISAIGNGSVPYVTGRFFDALIALSRGDVGVLWGMPLWFTLLSLWVIIQFGTNIIDWVMRNHQEAIWLKLRLRLEANGFVHLLYLPMSFHKGAHMSGTINTISNAGWRVGATVRSITTIAPQFLSMLIGITLAYRIDHALAGILLLGVFVYGAILIYMLRGVAERDDKGHRTWNRAWDYAAAAAHNAETVKQAGAEAHEGTKIMHLLLTRIFSSWMLLEQHWGNVSFFQRIVVFFTQLSVFVVAIHLIREHTITVGELVAVNGYALMFFGPLVQLGHSWQTIQNGVTAAMHLSELLDTPEETYSPTAAHMPTKIAGAITLSDVTFRYEQGQPDVLTHMDAQIAAGEVVALVGESGGGKSTMVGLISGYYFPTEGSVAVDGIDTRTYDLHALRAHIAIVPQEVTLWNDTIRSNIRYGSFGASDADIERVVQEAHLSDFVATLPKGLDTMVGERGVKLSVGQKQRVAIARAMLRDPSILILDEPTSALDAETEHHITGALERLMKGRTTLIIAHRLSTVRRADKILVFEKGHIVESGKHDELLKKRSGVYKKLYQHQIGLYE